MVLAKSVNKRRLEENLAAADFELSAADMDALDGLDRGRRYLHHLWVKDHVHFPFDAAF